ncbi:hypothetical protein BD413DRAFT_290325 [Trametes elegans]|nr:hypothetical protein BD413DRAFT_290325 [Trametes elegans]
MNVNQLQPPPHPQLQRLSREASEKDADFLALRLLNKRSRLRLSPQPLDLDSLPGKGRLFAVANRAGWFAAATRNTDGSYALVLSPLADLHSRFASSSADGSLSIQPRATVSLPGTPHIVVFTQDDTRLLIAFTNGPINVYDSQNVFQGGTAPLHTFPSSTGKAVRDILPSPGDMEQIAILREAGDGLPVEILDVHKMASVGGWSSSGSPATTPTSVSWSPKGKQIALGLGTGEVVTFSPADTSVVKSTVPRPQAVENQTVISTVWLSNPEFHAIYVPAGQASADVEQTHYILSLDSKANAAGDVKLTTPYLPFPGLRPPGAFVIVLRAWEPTRLLLFIGDSTSSDIGVIGSLADPSTSQLDSWYNFTLEETSTPSVPLDADMNETVLLGLELDLTNDKPYTYTGPSGEAADVPPPPIMYLYASDGTLTGWHIIQTQGVAYPGMASSSATPATTSPAISTIPNPSTSPQNAFAQPSAPSQPSAFGSTSTGPGPSTGFSAFSGAPAKFGSSGFGFGAQQSSQSPPAAPPMTAPSVSVDMMSSTEESMASETDVSLGGMSLGGGESSQGKAEGGTNTMFGSFGAPSQQNASSTSPFGAGATSNSAFAAYGAGAVKPATGFGAFGNTGSSAFGSPSAFGSSGAFGGGGAFSNGGSAFGSKPATDNNASKSNEAKPASGFGQSSFGQSAFGSSTSTPAFGQSTAFGQSSFGQSSFGKPAFGQSTFGNSSFGAATTPVKPASSSSFGSSSGGFAAFASAAPTSFAGAAQQAASESKPVWASSSQQANEQKSQDSSSTGSAFGNGSAFGAAKPTESASPSPAPTGGAFGGLGQASQSSAFGKSSFGQPSAFGQSTFGQSSFGQSAFGKSAFGQPATPASTPPKPASTMSSGGGGFASFANAGPSAFGAAAAQKSPSNESKPVWATPPEKPKEEEQAPKSAFGTSPSASSAFGSFGTPQGAATPSSSPEKPAVPANPATPATPEAPAPPATPATPATLATSSSPAVASPSTPATKLDASVASTTPATPATTGGAFGGLTTSATGFSKLQSGFGAFGSTTPSGSSPFLQKPSSTPQPSSIFGQTSFHAAAAKGADSRPDPTNPPSAFGTPSPLGQTSFFGKSSFGTPSSPSPFGKPAAAPASSSTSTGASASAFSAFSSAPSPFAAAVSGPKKSFGEMLREKEGGEKAEEPKPQGISKTAEAWKQPVSVFASLKQAAAKKGDDDEDEAGNVSFRSRDDDEDDEDDAYERGVGDDDIDEFLRSDEDDFVGEEEEEEEDEGPQEEEEDAAVTQSQTPPESPTAKQPVSQIEKGKATPFVGGVFLSKDTRLPSPPSSASPVPTVKIEPESPKLPAPSSPSEPISPSPEEKGKAPVRERSTTPPGSPAPTPPAPITRATSAPPAPSAAPSSSPGLLGLGRPSTRPVRSSPLASQPISGDDGSDEEAEDDEERATSSPSKKARSASPAIPSLGAQPTSRPKTPPLLFGNLSGPAKPPTPSPFSLPSATSPSLFSKPADKPAEVPKAEPIKPFSPAASPSLQGPGTPGPSSIFKSPPVFTPPALPQGGLFGQKPATPAGGIFGQTPAVPAGGIFGQKPAASSPTGPAIFGVPPAPSQAKPSTPAAPTAATSAAANAKPPSFFGTPSSAKPSGSFTPPVPPSIPPPALPAVAVQQPAAPSSQATVAQGMQTECLYLFSSLAKELEELKALASRARAQTAQLNKPGSGTKTAQDLLDPTKWVMGDLTQFKHIMKEVERELEKWEKEKATCISYIRELESDMLKATTRKEEIARFSRASQDVEFARMLKARALNPEHLETQAQLRREIRAIRGRIQQLEDHIQASKKKLNSVKNAKPTLKPPSLDTINRTYRNIDLAIEQEEQDVSNLADRVAQLDLSSHPRGKVFFSGSTRDKRLPDHAERVGREVTPNIAASTAAALNAERSAQKLKRALLKARKEPLLNTKVVDALPPERDVRSSRKPLLAPDSGLGVGAAFAAGLNNGLPTTPPVWTPPPPGSFGTSLAWSVPSPFKSDAGSPGTGAMRGSKGKQHMKPVHPVHDPVLKPPPPPPPAGFSWGPVPKIEPKQTISVFSNLGKGKARADDVGFKVKGEDLSASWVSDGFGASK